jgi:hypothetical protein
MSLTRQLATTRRNLPAGDNALRDTELENLAGRNPNDISGGEQQCLAVAGILAMEPKVLAFDEPVSMLDPIGKLRVMSIMQGITRRDNTTSIATESGADIEALAEVVDRFVAIDDGELLIDGSPVEVLQNDLMDKIGVGRPQVTELFLKLKDKGIPFEKIPISLHEACQILGDKLRQSGVQQVSRPPGLQNERENHFGQTVIEGESSPLLQPAGSCSQRCILLRPGASNCRDYRPKWLRKNHPGPTPGRLAETHQQRCPATGERPGYPQNADG